MLLRRIYSWYRLGREELKRRRFIHNGCIPWSAGYTAYKRKALQTILADPWLLSQFETGEQLPPRCGYRIDERAAEIPWAISRLRPGPGVLLDAGGSLNHDFVLNHPQMRGKRVIVCGLTPEPYIGTSPQVAHIRADLRRMEMKSDSCDWATCISTLEHIGMDIREKWPGGEVYESADGDYKDAMQELQRVLRPGGQLLITVPFGRYEDHGWLQQFDEKMLGNLLCTPNLTMSSLVFYKYANDGWQLAFQRQCTDSHYFDNRKEKQHEPDYVAAARSVACLEFTKP